MSYSINFVAIVFGLAVLLLLFIVPVTVVFFLVRLFRSKLAATLFVFTLVAGPLAYLYFTGYIGSTAMRIEKEHNVSVPQSASNIRWEPIFAISIFVDGGGTASFEISRDDLPAFLVQFHTLHTIPAPSDSTDWRVNHPVPSNFSRKITSFDGGSNDGNVMHMDAYDIDTSKVGIWIGTISN